MGEPGKQIGLISRLPRPAGSSQTLWGFLTLQPPGRCLHLLEPLILSLGTFLQDAALSLRHQLPLSQTFPVEKEARRRALCLVKYIFPLCSARCVLEARHFQGKEDFDQRPHFRETGRFFSLQEAQALSVLESPTLHGGRAGTSSWEPASEMN